MALSNKESVGLPERTKNALQRELNTQGTEVVSADGAVSVTKSHTNLSVSGTKAYTLASGRFVGQKKTIRCTAAASTPSGVVTGVFANAGVAATTITYSATTHFTMLEWTGAAWNVVYNVGAAIA